MAAILEDLEIDSSDMLSDPKAFAVRIVDKCYELKAILKGGISIGSHTENMKEIAAEKGTPQVITDKLSELYVLIDSLSTEEAYASIAAIIQFKSDVEYLVKDKIARDVTRESATVMEKKLAHQYYNGLRDLYGNFVSTISILDKNLAAKLPQIPAMPGNFGSTNPVKTFLYILDDQPGEEYWSPYAIIRKLGMSDKLKTMMDLHEFIESNPNCGVSMHEKVL